MAKIFLRIIGVIVLLFLIILFVIPSIFYVWYLLTGKHIQRLSYSNAPTVAQTIVDKGWDAKECFNLKLNPFELIRYPTESQHQTGCVSQVAFLKKDPSACELLMPSDYGFSCVGAAEAVSYQCTLDYGRVIEWGSYIDNTHERATLAECISGSVTSALGKDCCTISKAANIQGFDDCSSLESNSSLHDVCLSYLALKLGVSNSCNQITEPSMKSACMLRVKYKSVLKDWPTPISMEDAKKLN